ncbi:MAG: tyrosine-type recombinase/integrase [Actinomycetota bacterium]|nr:tyrosine-type recombinase/integrase [Actinomycetota bacterium]
MKLRNDSLCGLVRGRIPLSPALVALLKAHGKQQAAERLRAANIWQETDLVFTTEAGTRVDPRNALRVLTVAAKAAGLKDVNVHTLRHSAASTWIEGGVSLKTASQLLGHSDIAITGNIYAHVSEASERQAIDSLSAAIGL